MNNQSKPTDLRFAIIATDVVLFTIKDHKLLVRLIAVNRPPAYPEGSRGFPGGLIQPQETAEEAAVRIVEEKGAISASKIHIEQLYTFSEINRDPRGRVVSVSYLALVPWEKLSAAEKKNSKESWWSKVAEAQGLAYDHDQMLIVALDRLRSRIKSSTLVSRILPREFSLGMLEKTYEEILGGKTG